MFVADHTEYPRFKSVLAFNIHIEPPDMYTSARGRLRSPLSEEVLSGVRQFDMYFVYTGKNLPVFLF